MPARNAKQLFQYFAVAAIAMVIGLALLGVMLWNPSQLVERGLTGYVWYVLLLLLGLSAAVTTFALFKSYARYKGVMFNSSVELGGPAAMMLIVIVFGFAFVPAPREKFDVTVFLHGKAGHQELLLRNEGQLSLALGSDRRTEAVGGKGEARFVGIPADMRGQKVPVGLDADKYELDDPKLELTLGQATFYVALRAKQLRLVGEVADEQGEPLQGARLSVAGHVITTNEDGRFEVKLPADLPESDRNATISASGYKTWRATIVPGGNSVDVRLAKLADKE